MGAHRRGKKPSWALIGESLSLSSPRFFFIFLFSRAGLWLAALTALQHGGDGHVT